MRVAFVNNCFEPFAVGGAERSMLARARGLQKRGHVVKVFTLGADGIATERQIDGVDVQYVAGPWAACSPWHSGRSSTQRLLWHLGPEWLPWGLTDLSDVIRSFQPDLVNMANLPGLGFGNIEVIRQLGAPVVLTIADFSPLCAGTTMFRNQRSCRTRCTSCKILSGPRLARFNNASSYVFVSEYIRSRYARVTGGRNNLIGRAEVIHNGLDERMIGHALPSEAAKEGVTFGFLGQLKPTKGVEVLIQAFLSLADRSNYRLIIAGSGEPSYLQKLRELSGSDKRIELLGYTDPVEFFSRAQVVVIPSLWAEPLPRVGYEANFFGRPIIVSNRGGSAELIVAEENGSIFDPEDTGELSSQMTRWADRVSMSGRELAVACRDYALQRHHPEVVSAHYERVFADVLSKERV